MSGCLRELEANARMKWDNCCKFWCSTLKMSKFNVAKKLMNTFPSLCTSTLTMYTEFMWKNSCNHEQGYFNGDVYMYMYVDENFQIGFVKVF